MKIEIEAWLNNINERPDVVAINIGLIESTNGFQAYMIGSKVYDINDDEWACN
ncbi:MAG: hypothetical protein HRU38_18915 [Saccharospirillaceae bacterium]|nr:hypothetical protein [Pseudomonadales bacterium]NRB80707.1 hypothetical protein [Saccharospirillaceae bacterium]